MKQLFFLVGGISLWLAQGAAAAEPGMALALSCSNCHGPGGESPGAIPSIADMTADEIAATLRGFRSGELEGTIMTRIAKGYSDEEIDALSEYLATSGEGRAQ